MIKVLKKIVPYKVQRFIKSLISGNYNYFLWLFPINHSKIVVSNYYGKGYGDNGKYIVEEIINQGLEYDIVWLIKKELMGKVRFPKEIRVVKHGSIKGLYELATAKIWIDNCRKIYHPPKRKQQYYIQTGHGGIPLKKVEKDAEDKLSRHFVSRAKQDSQMADLMISNSTFKTNLLRDSFWYNGEILECGVPKIEVLMKQDDNLKKRVFESFNISNNYKIALYAPTFRMDGSLRPYTLDYRSLIKALREKFNDEWVVLVRLHPNIANKSNEIIYEDSIINASNYPDMQELMLVSDILITDYSGIMFEYIHTSKPVFLFATDINQYLDERGYYFDIRELPFSLSESNTELINHIVNYDSNQYRRKVNQFIEKLGIINDYGAASSIVEQIKRVTQINSRL